MQLDFPITKGSTGYVKVSNDSDSIRGRIVQLLNTNPGERVHMSKFGVGLQTFLEEPLDDVTLLDLRTAIYGQMKTYEPSLAVTYLKIEVLSYLPPATVNVIMEVMEVPTNRNFQFVINAGSPGTSGLPSKFTGEEVQINL